MTSKLKTEKIKLSVEKLNTDGLVTDLFHSLWVNTDKNDDDVETGICIPDTIVFSYSRPMWWYFTSFKGPKKNGPRILRKNRVNVTRENIVKTFCSAKTLREKRPSVKGAPVVAIYLCMAQKLRGDKREQVMVEYFTKSDLIRFLKRRDIPDGSVLQRFVVSSGQHTELIRATWSANISTVECRTNIFSMHDRRKTLYERLCTYEGPPHISEERSIIRSDTKTTETHTDKKKLTSTSSLNRRGIEALSKCEAAIGHIHRVFAKESSDIQVTRLQLFFRVDAKERMWLLWCSSCRAVESNISVNSLSMKHAKSLGSLLSSASSNAAQKRSKKITKAKSQGEMPNIDSLSLKKTYAKGSKLADALCPSPYFTTPERSISVLAKQASANVKKSERYAQHLNELFNASASTHHTINPKSSHESFLPKSGFKRFESYLHDDNIKQGDQTNIEQKEQKENDEILTTTGALLRGIPSSAAGKKLSEFTVQKRELCVLCKENFICCDRNSPNFREVSFRAIISFHDHAAKKLLNPNGRTHMGKPPLLPTHFIPEVILPYVPGGSIRRYQILRNNVNFMNRNMPVCKNCGIVYNGAAGLDDLNDDFKKNILMKKTTTAPIATTSSRLYQRPKSATVSSSRRTMLMTSRPKSAHLAGKNSPGTRSDKRSGKVTSKRVEFVPKNDSERERRSSRSKSPTSRDKRVRRRFRPKSAIQKRTQSIERRARNRNRPQSAHPLVQRDQQKRSRSKSSERKVSLTLEQQRERAERKLIETYGGYRYERVHRKSLKETETIDDDTPRIKEKEEDYRRSRATSRNRLGMGKSRPRSSRRVRDREKKTKASKSKNRPKSAGAVLRTRRPGGKENIPKTTTVPFSKKVEDETASLLQAALAKDAWRMRGKFSNKEERREHQKKFLQNQIDKVMANLDQH
eukprot:g958.t1